MSLLLSRNVSDTVALESLCLQLYSEDLMSDELTQILQWAIYTVLCQVIVLFGAGTNIINIICFVRQGFKEPINISLMGLAVADLCSLMALIWTNICYAPLIKTADLTFEAEELHYLTSGWPHVAFTRVSSWITAFITFERCICITMPLKVKRVITTTRVTIIIVSLFIILVPGVAPIYVVNRVARKFYPERNKTLLGLIATADREKVEPIFFTVYSAFVPFSAFIIIIICTATLVIKLKRKAEWRGNSSNTVQAGNVSSRNRKVAKMVVMISTFFIVCFIPLCIIFMAMALEPKFSTSGPYRNTLVVIGGLTLVTESINSSMNIFIYFHMSSRYRIVFLQLFHVSADLA